MILNQFIINDGRYADQGASPLSGRPSRTAIDIHFAVATRKPLFPNGYRFYGRCDLSVVSSTFSFYKISRRRSDAIPITKKI
ncbi:hypothetical protein EVAR_58059_1 [Eumeta japonica]|uniref:Uncharacterized protein n=1 Tax=Eumeta variegata TaxID=151549 RepID=A0A4C1SN58_EUMVA|nr:hypothetical protein EVAR_58059_1 [Eumeta japonica]